MNSDEKGNNSKRTENSALSSAAECSSTVLSEENSNRTSESSENAVSNSVTGIPDCKNQSISCQPTLDEVIESSNDTKCIDDVNDNQLVPDVLPETEDSEIVKDSASTNEAEGDQVVDGSKKESWEDDEENKLIERQISEGVLTTSMLDQEKELQQEHLEEEKHIVSEVGEIYRTL